MRILIIPSSQPKGTDLANRLVGESDLEDWRVITSYSKVKERWTGNSAVKDVYTLKTIRKGLKNVTKEHNVLLDQFRTDVFYTNELKDLVQEGKNLIVVSPSLKILETFKGHPFDQVYVMKKYDGLDHAIFADLGVTVEDKKIPANGFLHYDGKEFHESDLGKAEPKEVVSASGPSVSTVFQYDKENDPRKARAIELLREKIKKNESLCTMFTSSEMVDGVNQVTFRFYLDPIHQDLFTLFLLGLIRAIKESNHADRVSVELH